jgi:hypothetical protein
MGNEAVRWVKTRPPKGETELGETERQKLLANAVDVLRDLAERAKQVSIDIASISLAARTAEEDDMARRLDIAVKGLDTSRKSLRLDADLLENTYGAVGRLR